jgi:cytochrome c oxidase subunit 1
VSTTVLPHQPQARVAPRPGPEPSYLNVAFGVRSWLLTTDHKRIAILYLVSVTVMFFVGGAAATLVRLNLLSGNSEWVDHDTYNKLFTMHGIIMVFFFLVPVIPATLGNFLVPMMIGAKDLAFPRLNLASWYVYVIGAAFTVWAMLSGGVDTGWTFYTPFSTRASTTNVIPTAVGILIAGFSTVFTGLNFIVTIHRMRAPGLTWFRLPLFLWSMYATSVIIMLATPVLAMTLLLVAVERATASLTRTWVATRYCSSTSSGSTPTRRSTSWSCRPWASPARSCRVSHGKISSVITSSPSPASPSRCSASSSGPTTCSSAASRFTPRLSSRC